MGTIRVEYVPVQKFGLGLFFVDHLQIVYQDETDPIDSQDYWYVLEGVIDSGANGPTLGAFGEDGRLSLAVSNDASREALVAKIGTPESRGSRILYTGADALSKWDALAAYASGIEDQQLPYIAFSFPFSDSPTINSTSFVASVLWSIGIDVNLLPPFGVRFSPGGSTFIGTTGADTLRTTSSFSTLVGGEGDDTFIGRTNLLYLEKFYGGAGDDIFQWSPGDNIINGGQPGLAVTEDGLDSVDYSGAGEVFITVNRYAVDGKVASYTSIFTGGSDKLYSIEQVAWDQENDVVIAGEGVELLERPLLLDLKGQSGGQGDRFGLMGGNDALIINAVNDTTTSVQLAVNEGLDAGYWAQSVEWLVGSGGDDRIYSGVAVYGVDGGGGRDVLDGRLAAAFTAASPDGYDIELSGEDGDDIIVSNAGRTLARGGAGADTFVLSTMSSVHDETIEFVIADADANDKLYVPYDYFRATRGDYEGSDLFQLAGAPFDFGPQIPESYFLGGIPGAAAPGDDFIGAISYVLNGDDLIIGLMQARLREVPDGEGGTEIVLAAQNVTYTQVRVIDWSEGDLGITFPLVFDQSVFNSLDDFYDYPGLRAELANALSAERFIAPLDARPDPHIPKEIASAINPQPSTALRTASAATPVVTEGGDGDDVLLADDGGPYRFFGRGGDDDITGSAGGDVLDGGSGADALRGGRGNDVYVVDDAGDAVIEFDRGGFDRVIASIDYALPDFIEHLALAGAAVSGTGNALRNTLEGNDADNLLTGGDGDDTLTGNRGDDVLIGGLGGDGYVYEFGDGRDVIVETIDAAITDDDVLLLVGGVEAGDVTLFRDAAAPDDLNIRVGVDGGRISIRDYFAGAELETIRFDSGVVWQGYDLAQRAAAAAIVSNWAPTARDDAFSIKTQTSFLIPFAALVDNDSDEDGDALRLSSVLAIAGGGASVSGDGSVTVTPDAGASELLLDYTIADSRGGFSTARLTLTLLPNAAPVIAGAEFAAAVEDQPASGRLIATDADGDALTYAIKPGAGPAKGAITLLDDGAFVFTPLANADGADSFTLTVSDGAASPVEHTINFDIAAVNDAPAAAADSGFTVTAGAALIIAPQALLGNDRDIDGDALTIASVTAGAGLTVSRDAGGNVVVTAAAGPAGQRSFTYEISDGAGGVSSASVFVDVLAAASNAAPVITHAFLPAVREDRSERGRLVATDADGDALVYAIAPGGAPHKGALSFQSNGNFTYTPKRDANGAESFTLSVTDGKSAPVTHEFEFRIKPDYDLRDIFHFDLLSHGGVFGKLAAVADFVVHGAGDDWDGAYWRGLISKYGASDQIDL